MSENSVQFITISPEEEGQRLDNFLMKWGKGVPKSHIYRIIRSGEIRINKKRAEVTSRIVAGDIIRIPPIRVASPESPAVLSAVSIQNATKMVQNLPILYEDNALLIVNKPSGIAVHGGSGISLGLIEALRMVKPDLKFLELVHRLDRDTSGILMLAKKRSALTVLHEDIRNGNMDKRYIFVAHGSFNEGLGHIPLKYPLHKYILANGERRVRVEDFGQASHTVIKFLSQAHDGKCFVGEAQLRTGRTHQIRVQLQHHGYPILGDDKYGVLELDRAVKAKRLMLHAYKLAITHPLTKEKLSISAPVPEGFEIRNDR